MVLSIVLLIVGAIAYSTLPVAQYPEVVSPTVVVATQYPGATAQTVSETARPRSSRKSTMSRTCSICTPRRPRTASE